MGKIRRLRNHGAMVLSSRLLWESHFSNIFSRTGGLADAPWCPDPCWRRANPLFLTHFLYSYLYDSSTSPIFLGCLLQTRTIRTTSHLSFYFNSVAVVLQGLTECHLSDLGMQT